ncbi:MAG: 23S rRNA (pseudouridine(1915)-N(3))-methyltransferase RlmH [Candidatus Peribacteraceae bacterium]|nr:23S rRNA (pseudouridine(1915)-N(3))-methyltransferase RlmH [Candidatus Peribacteraceae bacterium]
MKIRVLAVARKPRNWAIDAEEDFIKRLKSFTDLEINLLAPVDENSFQAAPAKKLEAEKILAKISNDDFVVACDLAGQMFNSVDLAEVFRNARDTAKKIVFVIGGSNGLDSQVLDRADLKVAFSKMTFPHELFRVILLEQVYRAFTILGNRKYHK